MKIHNVEKLKDCKVIVMTGRSIDILLAAQQIIASPEYFPEFMLSYPGSDDYFQDFPSIISNNLKNEISRCDGAAIVETQSAEFLDCLLESDIDFTLATVRRFDQDDICTFRLRVLSKEEASENRCRFKMELRV